MLEKITSKHIYTLNNINCLTVAECTIEIINLIDEGKMCGKATFWGKSVVLQR